MRRFHFYDQVSGAMHAKYVATDDVANAEAFAAANAPPGHKHIEGSFDAFSQRVDLTDPAKPTVVDFQPAAPSNDHEWNQTTRRWHLKSGAQAALDRHHAARAKIDELEAAQPRAIREVTLAAPGSAELTAAIARLRALDDQIKSLRESV